jgi:hypothetical protein
VLMDGGNDINIQLATTLDAMGIPPLAPLA